MTSLATASGKEISFNLNSTHAHTTPPRPQAGVTIIDSVDSVFREVSRSTETHTTVRSAAL